MKYDLNDKANEYTCLTEKQIDVSSAKTNNAITLESESTAYRFYSSFKMSS
jgi:hypothetical protein